MSVTAGNGEGFSQFSNFDLSGARETASSGRDHTALLIIAEPREVGGGLQIRRADHAMARAHIEGVEADPEIRGRRVCAFPRGAYVYRGAGPHVPSKRIFSRVSLVSIIGSLALCLLVYPSVPLLLLSLSTYQPGDPLDHRIASFYSRRSEPDQACRSSPFWPAWATDQVVHFFNRSPQEWAKGGSFKRGHAAHLRDHPA